MTRQLLFAAGAALFALSVYVQHNDPDPVVWMLIYGAACLICVAVVVGKRALVPAAVVGVVALIWASTLASSAVAWLRSDHEAVAFTMKTGDAGEEEARECGGLLLVAAFMGAAAGWSSGSAGVPRGGRAQATKEP
ncbi:MAG: transmembrane 220 family protein [Deltaproteobacteria bacterium]|nr:transmembrane 220 family protein [Deltaproteobacteria bacterium]